MFDIQSLLEPVTSHAEPCGVTYTESETFLRIEEAIRADDLASSDTFGERKERSRKQADWKKAQELTLAMLQRESKDFRLLGVLASIEAELDGIPGLAGVVELAARLVQTFGPDLHPRARSGDVRPRLLALANFDKRLADCVGMLVGRSGALGGAKDASTSSQLANRLAGLQRTAVDRWELKDHPFGFTKCLEALSPLTEASSSPSVEGSGIATNKSGTAIPTGPTADQQSQATPSSKSTELGFAVNQPTSDRETALQQLRDVAKFFRRIEPHSPVAPLVEQAIRWADLPLEKWLAEVISDSDMLSRLRERLGIPEPEGPNEE